MVSDDFVDVYINSDNAQAIYLMDIKATLPHMEQDGLLVKRKRNATAVAFEEDLNWVLEKTKEKTNILVKLFGNLGKNIPTVEFDLPPEYKIGMCAGTDITVTGKDVGLVDENIKNSYSSDILFDAKDPAYEQVSENERDIEYSEPLNLNVLDQSDKEEQGGTEDVFIPNSVNLLCKDITVTGKDVGLVDESIKNSYSSDILYDAKDPAYEQVSENERDIEYSEPLNLNVLDQSDKEEQGGTEDVFIPNSVNLLCKDITVTGKGIGLVDENIKTGFSKDIFLEDVDDDDDDDFKDPDYDPESENVSEIEDSDASTNVLHQCDQSGNEKVPDSDTEDQEETEGVSLPNFVNFICEEMTHTGNDESEESQPYQRKLSNCDKLRDVKYPNIYIKKYIKSQEGKSGNQKIDSRPYDTVHACTFCQKLYSHIQDHIEKKHGDREMVIEIAKLKNQMKKADDKSTYKKQIKRLQDCLRFEGDHFHNLMVIENKEGELLIQRKSCHEEVFHFDEYGPCPECFQWIKLGCSIKVHQKYCPKYVKNHSFAKRELIWQARHLIGEGQASDFLREEVFTKMISDDIGTMAQEDGLVCKLGEVWLAKTYSHKLRRGKDSSFHMRLAARLLKDCRKRLGKPALDMMGLLTIDNFDTIVEATLSLCGQNEHGELNHPSTANKVGFDLARMVALKYGICLKNKDEDGKDESDGFLKYMKIHWSTKVSTQSNHLLATRHFENRRKLPHPSDIELVATKLTQKLTDFNYTDKTQYAAVAKVALLRLMVYNRRRSGEIEELKMEKYRNRRREVDDVERSMLGELTTTEKYLMKSQELMWIRGKRGKRVPVLIPNDTNEALNYVTNEDVRKNGGIKLSNQYMFASKGDGIIRASECIKELGNENASELIHPDRLTSTGYRAYMATIAQCLGLKDHQIQWLCTHLGHTVDVHQAHYRFALDGIERIELGKLLLLQDKNLLSKFKGTELKDIDFEDIISSPQEKEADSPQVQAGPSEVYDFGDSVELQLDVLDTDYVDTTVTEKPSRANSDQKKNSAGTRVRWTEKEIDEIKQFAEKYLKLRKTPSRKDCLTFIQKSRKSDGELWRRSPAHIVKKISAMNVKARKADN